ADKPRLLIRLGQVSLIARQTETALSLGRQALEMAVGQGAKGEEAGARFLIGRTCWACDPKDLGESGKQLDMARRLCPACEARPWVALCDTRLGGVKAQR